MMVSGTHSSAIAGEAQSWLEVIIRMPALVQYYNFGRLPADAPVTVANLSGLDEGAVDFQVNGHPVRMVSPSDKTEDTVEITKAEKQGANLRVDFRLKADGVRGFAVLSSDGNKWRLVERSVAER